MMRDDISLRELLEMSPTQLNYNEICKLDEEQRQQYASLLERFQQANNCNATTKEKGDALEELVAFLLNASGGIFRVSKNVRTATNEIDEIIELEGIGKVLGALNLIPARLTEFLGECKNYGGTIGVTYVGKFYSLLQTTCMNTGILFSYRGISGNGWADGSGLVRKIYLQREKIDERIAIIDFSYMDFKSILEGHNFLEIVEGKLKALRYDTSIDEFITPHPAEISFRPNGYIHE